MVTNKFIPSTEFIEKLPNICVDLELVSIYDMDCYSVPQLLYRLAQKINDTITNMEHNDTALKAQLDDLQTKLEYLLGEGLMTELQKIFEKMYADGTLQSLVEASMVDIKRRLTALEVKLDGYKSIKEYESLVINGDWSEAFKQAFSSEYNILLEYNKEYIINKPIEIIITGDYNKSHRTINLNSSTIRKKGAIASDTKDCIIHIKPPTGTSSTGGIRIINGNLQGDNLSSKGKTDIGVYAKGLTHTQFQDLYLLDCLNAFEFSDAWLNEFRNIRALACLGAIKIATTGTSNVFERFWLRDGNSINPDNYEYKVQGCFDFKKCFYQTMISTVVERCDNIPLYRFESCQGGQYTLASEDTFNAEAVKCIGDCKLNILSVNCLKPANLKSRTGQDYQVKKPLISAEDNSKVSIDNVSLLYEELEVIYSANGYSKIVCDTSSIDGFNFNNQTRANSIFAEVVATDLNQEIHNQLPLGNFNSNRWLRFNKVDMDAANVITVQAGQATGSLIVPIELNNTAKIIVALEGKGTIKVEGGSPQGFDIPLGKPKTVSLMALSTAKNVELILNQGSSIKLRHIMVSYNTNANKNTFAYQENSKLHPFVDIALLNNWQNVGGSISGYLYAFASYSKNDLGMVKLKGAIKAGSTGTIIGTLPVGYRPKQDAIFTVVSPHSSFEQVGQVNIDTSGNIKVVNGVNSFVSLDGIEFYI